MKKLVFLLLILLAGCGGGGGGSGPTSPSGIPQRMSYDSITQWLITYNSRGTGHSIRYAELPIKIQCYEGVDVNAVMEAANEWTRATSGAVRFSLTNFNDANIYIGLDNRIFKINAIGVTSEWRIDYVGGIIEVCNIRLPNIIELGFTQRDAFIITRLIAIHEIGHAIGIFNHTNDGSIMDNASLSKFIQTNYYGYLRISPTTASAISRLYSYPPGSLYVMSLTPKELSAQAQSGYNVIEDYFQIK
jgi:hypothetical protein